MTIATINAVARQRIIQNLDNTMLSSAAFDVRFDPAEDLVLEVVFRAKHALERWEKSDDEYILVVSRRLGQETECEHRAAQ